MVVFALCQKEENIISNYEEKVKQFKDEFPQQIIIDGQPIIIEVEFKDTGTTIIENLFNLIERKQEFLERN